MAQVLVRQVPDAVHAALRARARRLGVSAEALVRDLLAAEFRPEAAHRLGDQLAALWADAEGGITVEREPGPHAPPPLG